MERTTIKVQNYRNIHHSNPIELEMKEGINFILGLNNLGKSNLLRFFYEMRPIFKQLSEYIGSGNFGEMNYGVTFDGGIFFDQVLNRTALSSSKEKRVVTIRISFSETSSVVISLKTPGDEHSQSIMAHIVCNGIDGSNSVLLAEKIFQLSDTLYIGAFRHASFSGTGQYFDIEVGHSFINRWSEWAGGGDVAKMQALSDLTKELRELFDYKEFHITVDHQKTKLLVTTDDGTFGLDELGGGIAQFILVLGNALIKNPGYILIDEPEIGLHPKMQEVFVRALASKAKFGLLASSHSIGLARSVADSIQSISKKEDSNISLVPFGQHYEPTSYQTINEMGYSQFVEIGGNNILLVEGRTDIKSFREILRKYDADKNFIIISFGGRQFITADSSKIKDELNEFKRLNAKSVSVIFDSERTESNAMLKAELNVFAECCKDLGFSVFPTDYHSTENYITQEAIAKVLGSSYSALSPFENFNTSDNQWPKEKNWLMFREMKKEDINKTELGKFIENELLCNGQ